jgi:hypothetical protein
MQLLVVLMARRTWSGAREPARCPEAIGLSKANGDCGFRLGESIPSLAASTFGTTRAQWDSRRYQDAPGDNRPWRIPVEELTTLSRNF